MATPAAQLSQLIATTFDNYKETLSDNITQTTPLLAALNLKASVREDGGLTLRRPIMHALNSTVGSYSGYDTLDVTPQAGFSYAEYAWTQLAGSVVFSGEEELKNMGSSQIIALIRAKFVQLEESFRDMLSAQLWATSLAVSTDLLSVPLIVKDTGIIGGIDPSTETWWKSAKTASLDLDDVAGLETLNSVYNSLSVFHSRPDIEVTDQEAFQQYEQVAAVKLQFQQTKLAEMGFESLAHKGAELMFDPDCPNDKWYFLNSKHLEFVKHSSAWMKRRPAQMPHDQDASITLFLSMGQLISDSRRAHAFIDDTTAD